MNNIKHIILWGLLSKVLLSHSVGNMYDIYKQEQNLFALVSSLSPGSLFSRRSLFGKGGTKFYTLKHKRSSKPGEFEEFQKYSYHRPGRSPRPHNLRKNQQKVRVNYHEKLLAFKQTREEDDRDSIRSLYWKHTQTLLKVLHSNVITYICYVSRFPLLSLWNQMIPWAQALFPLFMIIVILMCKACRTSNCRHTERMNRHVITVYRTVRCQNTH